MGPKLTPTNRDHASQVGPKLAAAIKPSQTLQLGPGVCVAKRPLMPVVSTCVEVGCGMLGWLGRGFLCGGRHLLMGG
ncbi:hypothetical protein GCM10010174_66770 [Kutzneria viridogrisea]|uniref:Uncharacterized protein n=2 Tax=Kutzneria TaxID=43356 RepID=W5WE22_9PSEU|nr:hypothetical protein KALB_5464 [Kutzneria albida DSM 43870]MBA8923653.1 hypothetical protein [Kutzneria viridogrisea]